MKVAIVPYNKRICKSARVIARHLDIPCYDMNEVNQYPRCNMYINWGGWRHVLYCLEGGVVNEPQAVKKATNKLIAFQIWNHHDVPIPFYVTNEQTALFLIRHGIPLIARSELSGRRGEGVTLCDMSDDHVQAPLYTQFIDKTHEIRIHVWDNEVIDVIQKKRKNGITKALCWNHDSGYVFSHKLTVDTEEAHSTAQKAVEVLGLDFGAVDMIRGETRSHEGHWYVLEVNTAPGLTIPATYEAYEACIRRLIDE